MSKKSKSLFQNKLFQATLIVSMILVSSAIFISQSDNIFGKAVSGKITGTMVLHDVPYVSGKGISSFPLALPSDNCDIKVSACDYDNVPPTSVTVGADPKPSYVPTSSNTGAACGLEVTSTRNPIGWGSTICASTVNTFCDSTDVCASIGSYSSCSISKSYSYNPAWRCCPADHPIYDVVSDTCLAATTVSTTAAGNCATLTTNVGGLQDLTFNNANSDYVAVSYACTP